MKNITDEERKYIEENRRFKKNNTDFPWKIAFKSRSLRALVAAFFCSQWGNYFFIAWMPVYLQEGKHFSENEMKMTTFYLFVTGIIVALSTGIMGDWLVKKRGLRFGRRLFGIFAQGGMCLALLVTAVATDNLVVTVSLIIGHLFFAANGIVSFSTCVDIGGDNAGTVAGIMNFFGQTGAFFLAVSFGKIADLTHSFDVTLYVLVVVLFVGSLLWLFVDPTRPLISKKN